ncbi:MAG TPA: response regulator transcription factor [Acidimicrobiia bacterium]|nr:response regulator transcription factor [Acidimicrobiia bacterium]
MSDAVVRVLVVDDDVLTRVGLRTILDAEPDIEVVAEAADGHDAVKLAEEITPDIVLMDVRMRPMDGVEATQRITASRDGRDEDRPRVIVLTTFDHDEYVFGALRAGASGFLLKRIRAEELVEAVRVVADGEALMTPEVTRRLVADFTSRTDVSTGAVEDVDRLTPREREVLVLVACGLSNREIASWLTVSHETVKTHVKRIFTKLGVRDRAQAVVAAYEARLIVPGGEPVEPPRLTA